VNKVNIPMVAMAKLAPMSVSVGLPDSSFATICQRVWVPRWKPIRFTAVARVSLVASAAVEPWREVSHRSPSDHC